MKEITGPDFSSEMDDEVNEIIRGHANLLAAISAQMDGFESVGVKPHQSLTSDYELTCSEINPDLQTFTERISKETGNNMHLIVEVGGLPGVGKTTIAYLIKRYLLTENNRRRWRSIKIEKSKDVKRGYVKKFNVETLERNEAEDTLNMVLNKHPWITIDLARKRAVVDNYKKINLENVQWDEVEQLLMDLTLPEYTGKSPYEYARKRLAELSGKKYKPISDLYFVIKNIVETGKWDGVEMSREFLMDLQFVLQESQNYIRSPFDLTQPYPVEFMRATDILTQFKIAKTIKEFDKKGEKVVLIIDKVSGTGGFDRRGCYFDKRGYGSGLIAKINKRVGPFNILDREKLDLYGVAVSSLIPYPLTLIRMLMKMARSVEEAQLVLDVFNIPTQITRKDWKRMKTGGMFPHVREAETQARLALLQILLDTFDGKKSSLTIPDWIRRGFLGHFHNFDPLRDAEEANKRGDNPVKDNSLADKNIFLPPEFVALALDLAQLREEEFMKKGVAVKFQISNICQRILELFWAEKTFRVDANLPPENYILINNTPKALRRHLSNNSTLFNELFGIVSLIRTEKKLKSPALRNWIFDWLRMHKDQVRMN